MADEKDFKTKGPAEFGVARGTTVSVPDPFAPLMLTYEVGGKKLPDDRPDWGKGFIIGPGY